VQAEQGLFTMPKGPRKSGARSSRNEEIIPGVNRMGRSASRSARGNWRHSKKGFVKPKEEKKAEKKTEKEPKWYAADDVCKPKTSRKGNHRPTKLRPSITPGTVLIVLAGRFRGKRCIFLKQMESGLLLVSGPYKVNGVPLRRVNQAYVIATKTKLDIGAINTEKITDDLFAKEEVEKPKAGEAEFFSQEKKKTPPSKERIAEQKRVDALLMPLVKGSELMTKYLGAKFSLTRNDKPHEMIF
jgi:large subunit ribosomal protein L6e